MAESSSPGPSGDDNSPSLRRNAALVCGFHGLQMSLLPMAIITIFWKREIGMDMADIFILQASFGAVLALGEFPSGYISDRIGYRKTLMSAALIGAGGWFAYVYAESFLEVALAEAVLALSFSLASGCDSAMLYESLPTDARERNYRRWFGRFRFSGQMSEGLAALAAGFVYEGYGRTIFLVQSGLWLINAGLAMAMREPPRGRPANQHFWGSLSRLWRFLWLEQLQLRALVILSLVLGLSSFIPVWLIQSYAVDAGVPTTWLGAIWAAANIFVAIAALASPRLVDLLGTMRVVLFCALLVVGGYLGLGFNQLWWGFSFYFLLTIMRGIQGPALDPLKQGLIPSEERASMVSLSSALFRLCFCVVGPCVGFAIDTWGMRPVLLACAPCFALLLAWAIAAARPSLKR